MKILLTILIAGLVGFCTPKANAQLGVLPTSGLIGTVQNNTSGAWSKYTYSFTAPVTGSEYVGFAFRQDPAYWAFSNVSLTASGSSSNLLLNPNFTTGGPVTVTTSNQGTLSVQAPSHWGVFYQGSVYPGAAGFWQGSGGYSGGGMWYDGAVGSFDGIYQGVSVTAGTSYSLSFYAMSTYGTANTSSIQLGSYFGACGSIGLSPANCTITSSGSGFNSIATPSQTSTAGGVTVTGTSTTNLQSTTVTNGTPIVTTTHPTRTVNAVVNGQSVIETFIDTQTSTVTPVITTVYYTPTTVTTYSDGTTVTTQGTPTIVSQSTVNSDPVVVLTQSTTPSAIAPAYASNITPIEQARYNSAQSRLYGITENSVYITQVGTGNNVNVKQDGKYEKVAGLGQDAAPVQGNYNNVTIRQGDPIALTGRNLIEMSVYGDSNTLNLNQGYNTDGTYTGNDLAGHYQSVYVSGSSNSVTTSQTGQNHYAEVNITGNNNNQSLIQTGSSQQAFTAINGNNNTLTTTQSGSAGHFLDVSLTGDGNSVTATQSGTTQNKATISVTNAGGPAGVNLTQTGGQTYSISTSCVQAGGCGTVTVRQGN